MAVPYADGLLGLQLAVPQKVEVVDHVFPGLVVAAGAAGMFVLLRGGAAPHGVSFLVAAGLAFLAGLWITSTHVPLLLQAANGVAPWGPALFHTASGPVITVLSLWLLVPQLRGAD